MSELVIDTLPVLYDEGIFKLGLIRKDLQDGVLDKVETPIQSMMNEHLIESDERMESSYDENQPPRQSANLESLYYLVEVVSKDMDFAMHPNYSGKIKHDMMIESRLNKYYKTSIKKYARQIKIYIDGMIKYDNYPPYMFDDYIRLEKLIQTTDNDIADQYLLKLLTIVRQMIPPNYHITNSFVIDSNSVDPNKVEN